MERFLHSDRLARILKLPVMSAGLWFLSCFMVSEARAEGGTTINFVIQATSVEGGNDSDNYWVQGADLDPKAIQMLPGRDEDQCKRIADHINTQKPADLQDYEGAIRKLLDPNGRWPAGAESMLKITVAPLPENPAAGKMIDVPVTIDFPKDSGPERVEIYLVSRSFPKYDGIVDGVEKPDGCRLSKSWTLASLRADLSLPRAQKEEVLSRGISVQVIYAQDDVDEFAKRNRTDDSEGERRLLLQYQAVAIQYITKVREAKMVPGASIDEADARSKAVKIHADLLPFPEGTIFAKYYHREDGTLVFRFFFPGFGLREKAQIQVKGDSEAQATLENRYMNPSPEGEKRRLLMDGTSLPTHAMVRADLKYLGEDPLIAEVRLMESPDRTCYVCVPTALSKHRITVGAGAEYTADRGFTPLLGLRMPANEESQPDFRFELSGGVHSITGDAEYLFPVSPLTAGSHWDSSQWVIRAGVDDFQDSRYGNTERDDLEALIEEVAVGKIFRFDSFSHRDRFESMQPGYARDTDSRGRWFRTVEAGFRFRNTDLDGEAESLAGLDEGSRSGPYVEARFLVGDNLALPSDRSLVGSWMEGKLTLDTSLRSLGGDADYLRISGQLEKRMSWEFSGKVAGQIAIGGAAGWAAGGTPTFDYFGAGGQGLVRGVRDTEFIGRSYVGCHADLGFDVTPFVGKLLGQDTSGDSAPVLLVLFGPFVDIAWLFDRVENGRAASDGKTLQGYGVQLEILQGSVASAPYSISVGYGWCPQSDLEQSGSVFSHVSLRF